MPCLVFRYLATHDAIWIMNGIVPSTEKVQVVVLARWGHEWNLSFMSGKLPNTESHIIYLIGNYDRPGHQEFVQIWAATSAGFSTSPPKNRNCS